MNPKQDIKFHMKNITSGGGGDWRSWVGMIYRKIFGVSAVTVPSVQKAS
jgi:hypothetical protein